MLRQVVAVLRCRLVLRRVVADTLAPFCGWRACNELGDGVGGFWCASWRRGHFGWRAWSGLCGGVWLQRWAAVLRCRLVLRRIVAETLTTLFGGWRAGVGLRSSVSVSWRAVSVALRYSSAARS